VRLLVWVVYAARTPEGAATRQCRPRAYRNVLEAMHDPAHIDLALLGARPRAMAALLRYFRDLDTAEEAFQEACLRALQSWPRNGPPRDPTAWLIFAGRNAALDD